MSIAMNTDLLSATLVSQTLIEEKNPQFNIKTHNTTTFPTSTGEIINIVLQEQSSI